MNCLGSIRKFRNERRITSALSLQHLIHLKECSAFQLAKLAFRRMLSVSGTHWAFAPYETQNLIPVNADRPMELSSVILSNHFFGKELMEKNSCALAWYMGHLHVFKLSKKKTWNFLTIVGLESQSGRPIVEYLVEHQRIFKTFSQKFMAIEEESRSKRRKPLSEAAVSTIYSETRQKLKEVLSDFDFGKLPTSSPSGFIV
ncbi:putative secreted effector protein [Blumeria graminis f. sp. tritici 96224]|nr:putative secreted effector protein [Blumeria graminis f. sp. tritici 96224]